MISIVTNFIDFSTKCKLVRRTPLSCISSTAMPQSRISKVNVDSASNVSFLFYLDKFDIFNILIMQVVFISDAGCQMLMCVSLSSNSCTSFG